jgi:sialate O-acetylesterase
MRRLLPLLAAALIASPAAAGPLLNPVFQDHAVLQRDRPIAVWGEAAPGAVVEVELDGSRTNAVAGADGRWRATLPAHAVVGPFALTARSGGQTQSLADVLVGDVWLCSGQSNMEYPLARVTNGPTEVENSADASLRLLKVSRRSRAAPEAAIVASDKWAVATPQTTPDFSAACFFMGRQLRKTQGVPIGLIDASWGGSIIQDWMSRDALVALGGYEEGLSILAYYARSPSVGLARWGAAVERWALRTQPETAPFRRPDFDDHGWATIQATGFWEAAGVPALAGFDGVVWYRTDVTLTAAQARQPATLLLGPADDMDVTFVNGRQVGALAGWDTPRDYPVPAGTLKPGRNVIAVRVVDTGGGGGLWGPAEAKRVRFADGTAVPLGPEWRYRIGRPIAEIGPPPNMPWLGSNGLSTLYGGMIAPLAPYGLKGAAWYQGEANVGEPTEYARLLPALMADWRKRFATPDMPFLVVQLADFGPPSTAPQDTAWARLRETQRKVVAADPRAGLAVTIDIGDPFDIHPTNKQEVGRRLSLLARRIAYGGAVSATGPQPLSASRRGAAVVVHYAPGGLTVRSSAHPVGFELCDAARHCAYADARVEGDEVVLEGGPALPAFVRYAWADSPLVNLYDGQGLPAVPFEISVGSP